MGTSVSTQVIVLNGGSSAGKTGIARCLQVVLPRPWIRLGVDDLVDALPPSGGGIDFGAQGEVIVGETFRAIEAAWMTGVAAMAHAGARIILSQVHAGVTYDLEVDTGVAEALACARAIAARVV